MAVNKKRKIKFSPRKSSSNGNSLRKRASLKTRLILIFVTVKVIPLLIVTVIAWNAFNNLSGILSTNTDGLIAEMMRGFSETKVMSSNGFSSTENIAVNDAKAALNDSAVKNIERMSTDTAQRLADFLYSRDKDLRYMSLMTSRILQDLGTDGVFDSQEEYIQALWESYSDFAIATQKRVIKTNEWVLAAAYTYDIDNGVHLHKKLDALSASSDDALTPYIKINGDWVDASFPQGALLRHDAAGKAVYTYEWVRVLLANSEETFLYPYSTDSDGVRHRESVYINARQYNSSNSAGDYLLVVDGDGEVPQGIYPSTGVLVPILTDIQYVWGQKDPKVTDSSTLGVSTNEQNNDANAYSPRPADVYEYENIYIYDEITFISVDGMQLLSVSTGGLSNSRKKVTDYFDPSAATKAEAVQQAHQLAAESYDGVNIDYFAGAKDIANRLNTFVKAETYWGDLQSYLTNNGVIQDGTFSGNIPVNPYSVANDDIWVSDVIGKYVGTNKTGLYTPDRVDLAVYDPVNNASYAGGENPLGERFEGIVRWIMPVYKYNDTTGAQEGILGYVSLALDHDLIMEFVDHQTPMDERYTELPSAWEGNYAFIWDYQCRAIAHPRHNSIYG
ncbi:MAG: hypothetical protein LBN25_00560, partial [Christensenellaceae bacterium]|nr:hypothetical protein [Christensenellaceae bacterium]